MIKDFSIEFKKQIDLLVELLDEFGMAFYSFDEGYFSIYNKEVRFEEDLDTITDYLAKHYKTGKNLYLVTYLDEYDGGIAVGYQKAKELVQGIRENEFSREAYTKHQRGFDLLKEREQLEMMKWAADTSDSNIVRQKDYIEHLEEELKNFDKNLELTLKEYTKIEKINK